MPHRKIIWAVVVVIGLMLSTGCSLLTLPFQLAASAFNLIKHVPMPPPGVF